MIGVSLMAVILSREDGEGPVASGAAVSGYGSFAVYAAQDDTSDDTYTYTPGGVFVCQLVLS